MAEPLKNHFGPEVPAHIAAALGAAWPAFPVDDFLRDCLDGFDELELTPRARHIAAAMSTHLPSDRGEALRIVTTSLGPEDEQLEGMEGFRYLPHVFFVADEGLDHFEEAMTAQYELTKRFTAEFSIRAYIEHHYEATMARLRVGDPDRAQFTPIGAVFRRETRVGGLLARLQILVAGPVDIRLELVEAIASNDVELPALVANQV